MTLFARRAGALCSGISLLALACAAPAQAQSGQTLDTITVVATKTQERAIDSLAPVTVLDQKAI